VAVAIGSSIAAAIRPGALTAAGGCTTGITIVGVARGAIRAILTGRGFSCFKNIKPATLTSKTVMTHIESRKATMAPRTANLFTFIVAPL
jgi:hypothetical protein